MGTVTKKELAYRIAGRMGLKKVVVKRILQQFLGEIRAELSAGNRLEFREFGVFEVKVRAARKARNPRTGDPVHVPSKAIVHFKAGRAMKASVQRALDEAEARRIQVGERVVVLPERSLAAAPPMERTPSGTESQTAALGGDF